MKENSIKLTPQEIISLIKERKIEKNGISIYSEVSFLHLLSLISNEVNNLLK